ncbi:MAG: hypothetical protein ACKV1O_19750 [Saprospiraceae bacterium]
MRKLDLVSDLKEVAKGVAFLYRLEEDQEKKEHLNAILGKILKMLEVLESKDDEKMDDDDQDDLLTQVWSEVAKNFIKYGLEELFERFLEFGFVTYRV